MILGLILALIIPIQTESMYDVLTQGHKLFEEKKCSYCHSIRGMGGKVGPDLGHSALGLNYYEIVGSLWNHAPFMKERIEKEGFSWPIMEEEELSRLMTFIYYLNYFDLPGDSANGQRLFSEKNCHLCHRDGGAALPPSNFPADASHLFLARNLWNHAPEMYRSLNRQELSLPEFHGNELADIFAFVRSQATGSEEALAKTSGDPEGGKKVFQRAKCISCHAIYGAGADRGPDLSTVEIQLSITQIVSVLWNHFPAMNREMRSMGISHPTFQQGEMADLLSFLYSINFKGEQADREEGRKVFMKKCGPCHSFKGKGGSLASDLSVWNGKTEVSFMLHIWNKLPNMIKLYKEQGSEFVRLSGQEAKNVFAFILYDDAS